MDVYANKTISEKMCKKMRMIQPLVYCLQSYFVISNSFDKWQKLNSAPLLHLESNGKSTM